jgi:SpoVK/Ycf46/Vps4 family AAA+-type ATPase
MDHLLSTLISSLVSYYLPIDDIGTKVTISLILAGIISKFLNLIYDVIKKYDILNLFVDHKSQFCTINHDSSIYDQMLKYIHTNHSNVISDYVLKIYDGKNKFEAVKTKSKIVEKYNFKGVIYNIEIILFRENIQHDNDKSNNQSNNNAIKNNFNIKIKASSITIIEDFIECVIKQINTKIFNQVPIYRTQLLSGKERNITWDVKTVFLSKNVKNTIVSDFVKKCFYDDVENFMNTSDYYIDRGFPYKRGYILHGKPGCGKTSLIKAIANQYKLPIFVIDLDIFKTNAEFIKTINNMTSYISNNQKHLMIFEDIDRTDLFLNSYRSKISFDCLLNIIDGIDEAYGRITIMTANDINVITKINALIRPGRIDTIVEIPGYTTKEIKLMLEYCFINSKIPDLNPNIVITPAQLVQLILSVNNIEKIIIILNKQINFNKFKIENACDIYHENDDQKNNVDTTNDDMKNMSDDDVHSMCPNIDNGRIKYIKRRISKTKKQLTGYNIKINNAKNSLDTLSTIEKINYEKMILNMKLSEIRLNKSNEKLNLLLSTGRFSLENHDFLGKSESRNNDVSNNEISL